MEILVRKYTASKRFHPHYNSATDRYYHTAEDYVQDLKARGLEPYDPSAVKTPSLTPLKPSPWGREMVRTIRQAKRSDGSIRLGSRFYEALKAKGSAVNRRWLPSHYQAGQGGFDAPDEKGS